MSKVIITCAITGGAHTPSMSPYLPITPDDIAAQSIEAAEAGAAIIHLHARDPATGKPTGSPAVFRQFVGKIKQATDAVINISTGGGTLVFGSDKVIVMKVSGLRSCNTITIVVADCVCELTFAIGIASALSPELKPAPWSSTVNSGNGFSFG